MSASVSSRWYSTCSPCFASCDLTRTYLDYEGISIVFSGWNLSDIRQMPVRERSYWIKVVNKRLSERG